MNKEQTTCRAKQGTNNTNYTKGADATEIVELQWLARARPDIAYKISHHLQNFHKREQALTALLARHQALQTHHRTNNSTNSKRCKNLLDLDDHVDDYVDADWAGCPTTRKPTIGFNIHFFGTLVVGFSNS